MAVDLDHTFAVSKPVDEAYDAILDLDRLVPAVEGGKVLERLSPEAVRARSR